MRHQLLSDISAAASRTLDAPKKYPDFLGFLNNIEGENGEKSRKMYEDHREKMETSPGSTLKHQAWLGGYIDHLNEIFILASDFYEYHVRRGRPPAFSLSDAILTLFIHDLEKPWKYAGNENEKEELHGYESVKDFMNAKVKEYEIKLTDDHLNALKYVHGEGDDYDPKIRIQRELAAFIHICDTWSARIWYDYPLPGDRFADNNKS